MSYTAQAMRLPTPRNWRPRPYNQLNALFATVPGNYAQNLRKMYLLNSNYADLSFLFTIHPGEKTNPHLRSEYLAVLETDNATPYYLNLHNGEVFEPFFTTKGATGNGLGLWVCKQIIEKHSGTIWVRSRTCEPHGTTFSIVLPVSAQ